MNRYLLDTNMASLYLNRKRGVFQRARHEQSNGNILGICVPVLGELYFGVENSASRDSNLLLLERTIPSWRVWPYAASTARVFGRLTAHLARTGRPMQKIDIMTASIALELGKCIVVTMDSDFSAIPGLTVENWAQP